ncbi:hypothetical protein RIF29_06387 [Crotalaria pallida]|uniref:RRM domain-containing protein n=1 Tax=Crotalaria pallida TaxID=3830 RepID=A0AAN9J473_CROPI
MDRVLAAKDKGSFYGQDFLRNSTTFYFSNFSAEQGYEELWKAFQKWGKVVDVFIAPRRDKRGERFGFVRFANVENSTALAKNLDTIRLEEYKLKVNLPRFNRGEKRKEVGDGKWRGVEETKNIKQDLVASEDRRLEKMGGHEQDKKIWRRLEGRVENVWSRLGDQKMKVTLHEDKKKETQDDKVVIERKRNAWLNQQRRGWNPKTKYKRTLKQYIQEEYKVIGGLEYKTNMEDKEWLNKCWVGSLHDWEEVDGIQNIFLAAGFYHIKAVKMGGRMILLSSLDDSDMEDFFKAEGEWCEEHFEFFQKWSPNIVARQMLIWVNCVGIPLVAWEENMFKFIANLLGTYIRWDEDTRKGARYDVGRMLVATPSKQTVDRILEVAIENNLYQIKVMEEKWSEASNTNKKEKDSAFSIESDFDGGSSVDGTEDRWAVELQREMYDGEDDDDVATWVNEANSNSAVDTCNCMVVKEVEFNEDTIFKGQLNKEAGGLEGISKQAIMAENNSWSIKKGINNDELVDASVGEVGQGSKLNKVDLSWAKEIANSCRNVVEESGLKSQNIVPLYCNSDDKVKSGPVCMVASETIEGDNISEAKESNDVVESVVVETPDLGEQNCQDSIDEVISLLEEKKGRYSKRRKREAAKCDTSATEDGCGGF